MQFNGSKTITEIDVITTQDNYNAPIEPTESTTCSQYGLTAYQVQYWNGSAWTTLSNGSVTGNNKVWKKFTFPAISTTKIRVLSSASPDNFSRLSEVEAWTGPSPAPRYNLALNATATASSSYAGWPASSLTNGDRKSLNAGTSGGWVDAAPANTFPDWAQVDFGANKTINEIDVFTLQDNYAGSSEPTESMTFTQWGLTGFEVQYWDGSGWITVPNGSVSGNNKIWRKFTFSPISTSKIRVLTNASVDGYSRLTEIEAYGPADSGGSSLHWLVTDHLGTPRMIFDQTGDLANISRHDYLPFGEELSAPIGGRNPEQGYTSGDGVRQQFTTKERDIETGLDYFLARYYASPQGRFTSADPLMASGRAWVPQSWNRYSYVLNNPLNLIDPNGLEEDDPQDPATQPKPTERPLPKVTVTTSTDPRATNGTEPRSNVELADGTFATGVIAPLTITVTDQSGKSLKGLTITETNRLIESEPALPFKENTMTVTTDSNGSFTDVVSGNAVVTSERVSPQQARKIIENQVESRVKVVTEQTLTISASGQGVIATAVYRRTITNLDDKGNHRAPKNSSGRHVNNFSINVGPVTVARPKSP